MASSAAPEENSSQQQITNFFQGLKLVLHLPAKSFNKTDKINFVHYKILINFCEMKNYSEECPCYHTTECHHELSINHLIKLR